MLRAQNIYPRSWLSVFKWLHLPLAILSFQTLYAQLVATNTTLTVTSTNFVATFQGADLSALTNSLTGESYLNPLLSAQLLNLNVMNPTGQGLTLSNWVVATDPSSQQPMATLNFTDGTRNGTFQVSIDPQTREMVIHLSGSSQTPGVESLEWGIEGIDLSSGGRVVLPSQGGNYVDLNHFSTVDIQYPTSWAAEAALFQASQGGFLVYSTDSTFQFKDLYLNTDGNSTVDLQLSTEAVPPWPSATAVQSIEWRLTTFSGDWRAGATIYQTWSQSTWPVVSTASTVPWVRNMNFEISIDDPPTDTSEIDTIATLVDPTKTLLHLVNWTTSAAATNFPDYTPNPSLQAFVDHAHSLGFHVSLYTSSIAVDPSNSAYGQVQQFQMKTPDTLQPVGWEWSSPPGTPQREAYINPASSAWRNLFLNAIAPVIAAVGPDVIFLDEVPGFVNDGNGLIEGMNSEQGLVQMHKDLLARFPNVVFGTEGMTDVSLPYCLTAERWLGSYWQTLPAHPVTTFLEGGQITFHGHLSTPNPNLGGFLLYEEQYEAQGVLPLMHSPEFIQSVGQIAIARILQQVHDWQLHNYAPDWSGNWSSVIFRYVGSDGAIASLSDDGTLTTLSGTDGIIYQRARNVTQVQTSRYIDQWPAFDDTNLYGLDPTLEYWLDVEPRPTDLAHVTSLPAGVKLGLNTKITSASASISLVPTNNPSFNFFQNFPEASLGFTQNGQDFPLGSQPYIPASVGQTVVGGVSRQGIIENPPGPGAQLFIDYIVPLPSASSVTFQFSVGIADSSPRTAPIIFGVGIDGQVIWNLSVMKGSWENAVVDITKWAGQTVHLRLLTDGGTTGGIYGWAWWSSLQIAANVPPSSVTLSLALPPDTNVTAFTGSGSYKSSGQTATVTGTTVPGGFVAFLQPGALLTDGQSLIGLPSVQYFAQVGEIPIAQGSFVPPAVGTGSSGGVTESGVLITYPNTIGRSILGWTVQLPGDNPSQLSFSVGLQDGLPALAPVAFSVLVNGTAMWSYSTVTFGWTNGSVNLAAFQGQNVLIELVTDVGNGGFYVDTLWSGLSFTLAPKGGPGTPQVAAIVNGASYANGPMSPGEIVVLFGGGMGPTQLSGATLTAENTFATTVTGTQVFFDGIPAPLIYVSSNQIAAVVPYEVGDAVTQVQVNYQGSVSTPFAVPIATTTPALFSGDATGAGQAAALNQDLSLNSATNPAAAGSIIILYATGAGFVNPGGIDGTLAQKPLPTPLQSVSVQIGGINATVNYAGLAPGLIEGLLQVNATIPASLTSGAQPVVLAIGPASTRQTITIAVK
jgi:uncharacterized protein (TIGR03437 family)